jgi:hypothetical protein
MTWIDKLKDKSFQILFGMFIVGLPVFFSTSIVDQFITPRIVENLKKEQYLREDIKEGRYVVTDKVSFAKNNAIKGHVIQDLNSDMFARSADLKAISDKVVQLEASITNELEKSTKSLSEANQEIDELNQVIQALASKELKVTLFISDIDSDKGFVVLNIHNKAISQIIENDKNYYIYNDSGDSIKLRSRVEPAPAEHYDKHASIGRVHRDDYHELFSGTKSGVRVARIKID